MKYLIRFSYDGTYFHGFQRQNNVKNIQGTLENILTTVLNTKILIKGSGRTDAGVHAINQYAHFTYNKDITKKEIKLMNKLLNKEIKIKSIKKVPEEFHARFSVLEKTYIYKVNIGKYSSKKEGYFYQVNYNYDLHKLRQVAKILEGTHDFHNFVSGTRDDYTSTIKKIRIIKIHNTIYLIFKGVGFYRYMVRHLVGAILDVGKGSKDISVVLDMLNNPDIPKNLSVVPPQGLYLYNIKYNKYTKIS